MRRILQKKGVIWTVKHQKCSIKQILTAADRCYPPDYDITITRGCEKAKGGKKTSKHLYPKCDAIDLRTRDLPAEIDRQDIVYEMQKILGSDYYGYYKKRQGVEWIHFQYNGGK